MPAQQRFPGAAPQPARGGDRECKPACRSPRVQRSLQIRSPTCTSSRAIRRASTIDAAASRQSPSRYATRPMPRASTTHAASPSATPSPSRALAVARARASPPSRSRAAAPRSSHRHRRRPRRRGAGLRAAVRRRRRAPRRRAEDRRDRRRRRRSPTSPTPTLRLPRLLQTPGSPPLDFSHDIAPWLGPQRRDLPRTLAGAPPRRASQLQQLLTQVLRAAPRHASAFPFALTGVQGAIVLDTSDAAKASSFLRRRPSTPARTRPATAASPTRRPPAAIAFGLVDRFAVHRQRTGCTA